MVISQELARELDRTRTQIDELRELEHRLEADYRAVPSRVGWLRALWIRLLRRDLLRQVQYLKLRNSVVRNCYLEAKRDEAREPARSRR